MDTQAGTDLCRITLAAPRVRLDVALPTTVPLAALLPALLTHVGEDAVEEGATHGGWAVQRVGEPPLDGERTILALGIRDGEVLYLRPRRTSIPTVAFDDPVDAIGHVLREDGRRWTPQATALFSLIVAGVLLVAGALAGLTAGPPWLGQAVACAVAAPALVAAGALVSQAFLPAAGTVLGVGGTAFAFVGGLLVLAGRRPLPELGARQLAVGLGAALLVAVAAAVALDRADPVFVGIAAAAALAAVGALVGLAVPAVAAAGVELVVVLALTPWLPRIAYRVAGLPKPVLAVSAEEMRRHGEPLPAEDIRDRTRTADRTLTALTGATSAVAVGCEVVMLRHGWSGNEWAALGLCSLLVPLVLLRARLFSGRAQRLWLLGAGVTAAVALGWRLIAWFGHPAAIGLTGGLVLAAGYVVSWAVRPDHRVAPPWMRASDLLELVMTLALVPLVLELLGVYGAVRALTG